MKCLHEIKVGRKKMDEMLNVVSKYELASCDLDNKIHKISHHIKSKNTYVCETYIDLYELFSLYKKNEYNEKQLQEHFYNYYTEMVCGVYKKNKIELCWLFDELIENMNKNKFI